jgi:hypothetical protein
MELSSAALPNNKADLELHPAFSFFNDIPTAITMQRHMSTVDRLDRPSAYYQGKV